MARIESLTLHGFKSFGEKVRLEFGPGITAVVGPNGSGKSNVVEALRWVTHSARARALRAATATDLIFHGAEGKGSVGLAEVQLELSGGLSLARRLYRDGESEQDLRGRRVRVRDALEALSNTGLGAGSLSVVGQGEVSMVVAADPKTLLEHLEEAAGLGSLASSRTQTLDRLLEAERGLDALNPLHLERIVRVEDLRRESARAEESTKLKTRQTLLERTLVRAKRQTLLEEILSLRGRVAALEARSSEKVALLERITEQLEHARVALSGARAEAVGFERATERTRAAEREFHTVQGSLNQLETDFQRMKLERETLDTLVLPELPNLEHSEKTLFEARARLKQCERDLKALEAQLEEARRRELGLERESARRIAQAEERERLESALKLETESLFALEQNLTALKSVALESPQTVREQLETLRSRMQELRLERSRFETEMAALERERSRLDKLLSSHARYGEGPRNALSSGLSGILGSVADLLSVPEEFETALVSALGRRLEQVVVQDSETARKAIAHLKKVGGRATFLPLDLLRPRFRREGGFTREAGVVGWASEVCPSSPQAVSDSLLGDTLLVEKDADAVRIARKYSSRPRLVSLDGEVLEPGGALTGGRLQDTGVSHLSDLRRLDELNLEADLLERKRQGSEREKADLEREIMDLETQRMSLEQTRVEREAKERPLERDLERSRSRLGGLKGQLEALLVPLEAVSAEGLDKAALEESVKNVRLALEQEREIERGAGAALEQDRRYKLAFEHAQQGLERRERLDTLLADLERRRLEQLERTAQTQAQLETERATLADLSPPELAPLETQLIQLERDGRNQTSELSTLRGDLETARLTLARRETALGDVDDVKALEPLDLPGSPRSWTSELLDLERRLETLGVVNPLAPTQQLEEEEKLSGLERDMNDARDALVSLREALGELEDDLERGRSGALERVQRSFSHFSSELLGGSGEVVATRGISGRLEGLTLAVQPADKRTRALNLLSTGERTLVGLAFLFALAHAPEGGAGGLPLAVLDEVDAPLDEANIRRFAHFLKLQAAAGTQFILVTHQKATMEVADFLWGITTVRGVSRSFSIRSSEEAGV